MQIRFIQLVVFDSNGNKEKRVKRKIVANAMFEAVYEVYSWVIEEATRSTHKVPSFDIFYQPNSRSLRGYFDGRFPLLMAYYLWTRHFYYTTIKHNEQETIQSRKMRMEVLCIQS